MSTSDPVGESQPLGQEPDEREQLREEIERVREDLGETVEALANKADLKGQVHDRVEDTKAQVHDKVEDTKAQVQGKVEEVKAHVGMGAHPAKPNLRRTLDGPAVPAALAALCGMLLLRSILRRR